MLSHPLVLVVIGILIGMFVIPWVRGAVGGMGRGAQQSGG